MEKAEVVVNTGVMVASAMEVLPAWLLRPVGPSGVRGRHVDHRRLRSEAIAGWKMRHGPSISISPKLTGVLSTIMAGMLNPKYSSPCPGHKYEVGFRTIYQSSSSLSAKFKIPEGCVKQLSRFLCAFTGIMLDPRSGCGAIGIPSLQRNLCKDDGCHLYLCSCKRDSVRTHRTIWPPVYTAWCTIDCQVIGPMDLSRLAAKVVFPSRIRAETERRLIRVQSRAVVYNFRVLRVDI